MPSSVAVGVEGTYIHIDILGMASPDTADTSGEGGGGGGSRSGMAIGWSNWHVLFFNFSMYA